MRFLRFLRVPNTLNAEVQSSNVLVDFAIAKFKVVLLLKFRTFQSNCLDPKRPRRLCVKLWTAKVRLLNSLDFRLKNGFRQKIQLHLI